MSTDYKTVPYESFPHTQTQPQHLYVVGKLFGMTPADFKKARILEIGTASGGNLIPLASTYPEAEFVGIDLSPVQIEAGRKTIEELGLTNIRLEERDVTTLSKKEGLFDYIICHGVFSWVSSEVQDSILKACKEHLSPQGIAFVSYNTLPGWNMVRTLRDMMLYQAKGFETPGEKFTQAKAVLEFVKENVDANTLYGRLLKEEVEAINSRPETHQFHEYLEPHNEPMYFQDFMSKAQGSELQYLADASVASMFTGNLPAKAAEALAPAGNDIVRTEQYMDFLTNRRFRSTLLCHEGVALSRALTPQHLEPFYVRSFLSPTVAVDLQNLGEGAAFISPTGLTLTVHTPETAAIMLALWENNNRALSFDQITQLASEKLGEETAGDTLKSAALDLTMRLFLAGTVQLYADAGAYSPTATEKPEVLLFARHQARSLGWVTNGRHERANMDLVHRIMLQYMDGHHDQEAILEKMMGHLESGELVLRQEDKEVPVGDNARTIMKQMIANATEMMARNALLSA